MGTTTIQVKKRNLRLLNMIKRKTGAKSYDEALEKLLAEELKIARSMFGADRDRITRFGEEDRLEDRNADIR